jgi:hypothetical protein
MGKSNKEKLEFAHNLIQLGTPYREIQLRLKNEYGSGVSNNTLKKMNEQKSKIEEMALEIATLKKELVLFKNLYFELLESTEKKFGK